jgi:HD-GYP domain-containing protein (c-di-GMP phosphodiesterase class II)
MNQILVWGNPRDLVSGDLPASIAVGAAQTLADVEASGAGPCLLLVDPERLAAEAAGFRAWLETGHRPALVLAVAPPAEADALLERYPFLDDVAPRPLTPLRLRRQLDRAVEGASSRRVISQLDAALARKSQELHELNKIGVALSAERDIDKLLEMILAKSREITAADAGSLYLVERGKDDGNADDMLRFKLTQNDSLALPFREFTMALNESSMAGYAALSGQVVNVADAYSLPAGAPFQSPRSFDEQSGYRTRSMLAVPMKDHEDLVIGVVQLINKKRDARAVLRPVSLVDELVVPFTAVDEELVSSLASQAAVAFENTKLIQDIKALFDKFVSASVTAIESRDPTTSGHSERVAELTVGLAMKVDGLDSGPFREVRFTRDQVQEINYASLLHDFGKVGVREKVLIKGKKLYVGEMLLLRQRYAYIKRTLETEHLRAKLSAVQGGTGAEALAELDASYAARQAELDYVLEVILKANEPSVLEEDRFRALMDLPNRSYTDIDGQVQPFLTPNEVQALSIRRGSLSEKERREIESHVTHTYQFLAKIPWTGEYRRIPDIAYAHHEKLDGTGYPRRLSAPEIPLQSRMMTISDIFDALVAWDRPYKKAVPVKKALDILRDEAKQGKLDVPLLDVFVEARLWEPALQRQERDASR